MLKLITAIPCPFCTYVIDFINENNITSVEIYDTCWNKDEHLELKEKYGKTQVPLLLIDGKPLYESADIIDYLDKNAR